MTSDRARLRLAYLSIGRHIHTERWLAWFARRGHEVHLLTVQPGDIPNVTVHDIGSTLGPKPVRYGLSLVRVRRLLRRLRPDLLHTHFLTGYGYWGLFSGMKPFLLTVWGDDVYVTPHETRLKGALARGALRRADYVTGDSEDILRACVALGADPERVEVVQWGVDLARFRPGLDGREIRQRLGIPSAAPVVLSTRSFTQPYYNIDVILETAPRVRERHPDVHYLFGGLEGSDERFRREAERKGMAGWVHWLGRIPHEELPVVLGVADAFLTVPSVDATAVSLLEAMASGTPVVASDLPSATEWVRDGETGLVVPPRNGTALVNAVDRLLSDGALRARLGRAAREVVAERADHDRHMQRVEEIYYDLAEGRSPRPAEAFA